ncbi:fatty acid desaturase [Hoeflea sp. TYP-13]|uniref:fatty acid desaturase n=1 Tax=Hoeflea sp. TYP-13 TaxID=3230023 RepID=UPI0034C68F52
MPDYVPTNAASSGVKLDKKTLKAIARRSDRPGLIYLAQWVLGLILTGALVWAALGTLWIWPAMFVHGVLLTVPAYSFSHETAHGTAFKARWLNEAVLWITSLIYIEEPLHRRYTHTNHHTFTWHVGKDSQMPFDTPMALGGWLAEITGFALLRFHTTALLQLALGRYTDTIKMVTPDGEYSKMTRNARIFLVIYAAIAGLVIAGFSWPLWFLVLPRLLGAPVMLLFTLIQHVELQENSPSILESTRSFKTSWLGRFLYMNMNNHVEHHLYPQVPFYALPALQRAVAEQVPEPDPGFFRTNWEVLTVAARRSLGLSTRAPTIRQAPHMISDGGSFERVARRTM